MASSTRVSLCLFAVLLALYFLGSAYFVFQLSLFLIYALVTQGVGYVWSRTGILPLGQSFFFGIGAYLCAATLKNIESGVLQFFLMMAIVAVVGVLGFFIAALVFKGKSESGPFFSFITLALAMIAMQVANSFPELTGGFNGMGGYAPFMGIDPFGSFYLFAAAACALVCFLFLRLDERPLGIVARAIEDNEPRLQLLGFATHLIKAEK